MATRRQIFYSFHYKPDNWRVSMVRNIGTIVGNKLATDNAWETIKRGGDTAIKRWINDQMRYRSCTVVLVGSNTANRKWINYEIVKSWNDGMGVVGIRIHGLRDSNGDVSTIGNDPFSCIKGMPSEVKCYNPAGANSTAKYAWIAKHLSNAVEEAIRIRKKYP